MALNCVFEWQFIDQSFYILIHRWCPSIILEIESGGKELIFSMVDHNKRFSILFCINKLQKGIFQYISGFLLKIYCIIFFLMINTCLNIYGPPDDVICQEFGGRVGNEKG